VSLPEDVCNLRYELLQPDINTDIYFYLHRQAVAFPLK